MCSSLSLVALFGALSFACGARSELDVPDPIDASSIDAHAPDAARDVALDADADSDLPLELSPFCVATDAGVPEHVCTTTFVVGSVFKMASGCYVDVVVHEGDIATVSYACDDPTSSWAAVTVGGTTFLGSLSGKMLDVCIGMTYPWEDGPNCHDAKSTWASAQRIYGDITSGTLTFVYDEKEIAGGSCALPCWAQGTLSTN